jgi:hypothetical protein
VYYFCCKLDSALCIETSKELRTRLAEVVYVEYADQSLTKQLVTCSMDTAYPPIRNNFYKHAREDYLIFSPTFYVFLCILYFYSLLYFYTIFFISSPILYMFLVFYITLSFYSAPFL